MFNFIVNDTPVLFLVQSFWRDEAFSFLMAKEPVMRILSLTAQDSNPPLYYVLLKIWMSIGGTSEVWLRLLSSLFFVGTCWVFFLILRDCVRYSQKASLLWTILVVINPLLHYYAFEARMYTQLSFFSLLYVYAILMKRRKTIQVSAILGLYTHYFFLLPFAAASTISLLREKQGRKKLVKQYVFILLVALPWFVFAFFQGGLLHSGFWIEKKVWQDIWQVPFFVLTGYEKDVFRYRSLGLSSVSLCLIYLLSLTLTLRQKKHTHAEHISAILGIGIPLTLYVVSLFMRPLFLPRYIIFSSPFLILSIALSVKKSPRILTYIIFFLLSTISLHYADAQIQERRKENMRTLFKNIQLRLNNQDVVYVTHEFDFHTAQYYCGADRVYLYGKTHAEIPWYVGKVLISKGQVTGAPPTFPHRAFVIDKNRTVSILAVQ